jgi:hypothetical protein
MAKMGPSATLRINSIGHPLPALSGSAELTVEALSNVMYTEER